MTAGVVVAALVGVLCGAVVAVIVSNRRHTARLAAVVGHHDRPHRRHAQLAMVERLAADAEAQGRSARAAEQRLHDVLEGIPAAVVVFGPEQERRLANEAGSRLIGGRHGDALVGAALKELVEEVQQEDTPSAARTLSLVGPPRRHYALTVHRLADGDHLAIAEDVTERRRLEEVRRDFVANISHELKTPIGAMSLLAEAMSAEDDPELIARLSQRLHHEALRVGGTIDDLLLLSRIEADDDPVRERVNLDAVVHEAALRVEPAAEPRGIELKLDLAEPAVTLWGDRRQLLSAIYNLLENAVKYSDPSSVVVVRTAELGDAGAVIEVVDRGIGIPPKDLERIFERFYRVDRARSRVTGGTGLGLAIVRHVVENHGGTVAVSSREGEGSTFTLTLPVGPSLSPPGEGNR